MGSSGYPPSFPPRQVCHTLFDFLSGFMALTGLHDSNGSNPRKCTKMDVLRAYVSPIVPTFSPGGREIRK